MNVTLKTLAEQHRKGVIDIFNHYIREGFAAYPETAVEYSFFDIFMAMTQGYPAVAVEADASGSVAGFGFLRPYSLIPVFSRTAEISYFIAPDYTGNGIGGIMLGNFIAEAGKRSIDSLIAGISSRNDGSIRFHHNNGFRECGRLEKVGKKFGEDFDVVLMQHRIV
jgi:phosphinothricin acetyltransferase